MSYPYPFLIGNNCFIYEVRPKLCRSYFSSNLTLCENGEKDDLSMGFNLALHKQYQNDYPENFKDNSEIIGHVHRCIDYSDGKFVALL